jgi:hypothetical protein
MDAANGSWPHWQQQGLDAPIPNLDGMQDEQWQTSSQPCGADMAWQSLAFGSEAHARQEDAWHAPYLPQDAMGSEPLDMNAPYTLEGIGNGECPDWQPQFGHKTLAMVEAERYAASCAVQQPEPPWPSLPQSAGEHTAGRSVAGMQHPEWQNLPSAPMPGNMGTLVMDDSWSRYPDDGTFRDNGTPRLSQELSHGTASQPHSETSACKEQMLTMSSVGAIDWGWQSGSRLGPLSTWPCEPTAAQVHGGGNQDERRKIVPLADAVERRTQARAEELATTESTRSMNSADSESDGSELLASCWPNPDGMCES